MSLSGMACRTELVIRGSEDQIRTAAALKTPDESVMAVSQSQHSALEAPLHEQSVRDQIVATYAEWTAMSALRSGAPIKSRRDVYTVLRGTDFSPLFDKSLGPINKATFESWHAATVADMMRREPRLSVGWAAKIVNVYLKTRAYIGSQGRHHLTEFLHPPIDGGLWLGLRRRFKDHPEILAQTHHVERIKDITDYQGYQRIMDGCRAAAKLLDCKLIEVEQLWAGTEITP